MAYNSPPKLLHIRTSLLPNLHFLSPPFLPQVHHDGVGDLGQSMHNNVLTLL
jgi:hypothetical protein